MESRVRVLSASIMVLTMSLAGCLGGINSSNNTTQIPDWDKEMTYIDDPITHSDSRFFDVSDPFLNQSWGNSSWAVFGNEEGGNCCEHYLAATKEGWILNFGGEYPTWSEDRGFTWQEYRPSVFSQIGC